MSFIDKLYQESVSDNEKNLLFWEDYLNNLKALDFSVYSDKLKIPTLVPIGSRVFFRGELKHTNEVTVALGADYFVKCSLVQADILRKHRIKDAESKLESFRKGKEYLENHLSFTRQNLFDKEGHEIVEVFTEEEDKAWRQKHRENVRNSKKVKIKEAEAQEITDEELWNRLEELELEEELENELMDNYNEIQDKRKDNSFLVNEEQVLLSTFEDEPSKNVNKFNHNKIPQNNDSKTVVEELSCSQKDNEAKEANKSTKLDLLQKVLDKQNQLEDKLLELKNRDRQPSKTKKDLMSRLDEMDELDDLEDEMDRLDDVLETENISESDDEENIVKTTSSNLQRSISFADEKEATSETMELTFKHSDVEPSNEPYNIEKGISKPSDIYDAYSHLFDSKPTSILKKSRYESDFDEKTTPRKQVTVSQAETVSSSSNGNDAEVFPVKHTIVVKDVTEKSSNNRNKIDTDVRPTSLFKKKRMQSKS